MILHNRGGLGDDLHLDGAVADLRFGIFHAHGNGLRMAVGYLNRPLPVAGLALAHKALAAALAEILLHVHRHTGIPAEEHILVIP